MGISYSAAPSHLASALFSRVQQRVLGLLFGQPDRRFQSAELIRLAASGTGAVHRQLNRLEAAGWITATRIGNQKFYQANSACPAYAELQGLIAKTVGLTGPLRNALLPYEPEIQAAFVYGSVAKGTDQASSDIDLLVISESIGYPELFQALEPAEQALGRSISPTVMTPAEWRSRRAEKGSFADRIAAQSHIFLIGVQDDLS